MKRKLFPALGLLLAAGLSAQINQPPAVAPVPGAAPAIAPAVPAVQPAPIVAAPAPPAGPVVAPPARPAPRPMSAPPEPRVALVPGPAAVDASNVNVRGRGTILSEAVAQLDRGDVVTVIEQVENPRAEGNDRRQWARIVYPPGAPVWVFGAFVSSDHVVTSGRLNLRAGPGENYSIVGRLTRGATVREVRRQGEWIAIEAPAEATAFVAAAFLKQDAAAIAAAAKPAAPAVPVAAVAVAPVIEPPATTVITEIVPAFPPPAEPVTARAPVSDELAAFLAGAAGGEAPPVVETEEPLPPRIVMREGVVSGITSIQAPSYYGLRGLDTGRTINYLYTASPHVDLGRYIGLRIIVTGEESLDQRWPNTPVLTIRRIQVVE